jgi:imidazoleglycerol phosphate dehydratase HisB
VTTARVLFVARRGALVAADAGAQAPNLMPGVIPALLDLRRAGHRLVSIGRLDDFLRSLFASQGVAFQAEIEAAELPAYAASHAADPERSFVILGASDDALADGVTLGTVRVAADGTTGETWPTIASRLARPNRIAEVTRQTRETDIAVRVNLDQPGDIAISTGIGFFDHMLEQVAKHGEFSLDLKCRGDLEVDEHHTVEDCALALGQALREALGDKRGIGRYGFVLPMDEALAQVAIDLSGRSYAVFTGRFGRDAVGGLPTELVPHFFRSLADAMGAAIHVEVKGENTHHMVEACFKGVGRALRRALRVRGDELPSSKGVL